MKWKIKTKCIHISGVQHVSNNYAFLYFYCLSELEQLSLYVSVCWHADVKSPLLAVFILSW
jgi:hypothetical protein